MQGLLHSHSNFILQGGLKAVVWTDALQSIFIAVSITSILILGTSQIGGFSEVFRIAKEGHRLELLK